MNKFVPPGPIQQAQPRGQTHNYVGGPGKPANGPLFDATRSQRFKRALLRATGYLASRGRIGLAAVVVSLSLIVTVTYFYIIPTTASTYIVPSGPVWVDISGPGILDALQKVTITARAAGFLKKVYVDNNDRVKKGDLIAELEAADVESQLMAAQAEADAAAHAVEQAKSDQSIEEARQERSATDLKRRRTLSQTGSISMADFDTAVMTSRQADASLVRSKTTIQRAIAQAAGAAAQVRLLTARLEETKFHSPMNAVVVSRERSSGDLLAPLTSLFKLVDPSTIIISARLDESVMGLIQPGQEATLEFVSSLKTAVKATVLRVGRSVDTETREFIIDVVPKELPVNWAIGQRANVRIRAKLPQNVIAVPQNLIARQNGQTGVWKLQEGAVRWTAIDMGMASGQLVEILSGLSPGDTLVSPKNRYEHEKIWPKDNGP